MNGRPGKVLTAEKQKKKKKERTGDGCGELGEEVAVLLLVAAHGHGRVVGSGHDHVEQFRTEAARVDGERIDLIGAALVQARAVRQDLLSQVRVLHLQLERAA